MDHSVSRPADTYSPIYFLASLGAGGIAVTFFMFLMFWVPHPGQPVPVFEDIAAAFATGGVAMQAAIAAALIGIAVFAFLNIKSLIWNLHSRAHDFDSHTSDLEEVSRKIFSAHFGHLAVIFIWLSGAFYHGARFSNYSGWLADPTHVKPSAQVVWPVFGQEILNGDVGAGFHGIQITSGLFHMWRSWGYTNETQLLATAIGAPP